MAEYIEKYLSTNEPNKRRKLTLDLKAFFRTANCDIKTALKNSGYITEGANGSLKIIDDKFLNGAPADAIPSKAELCDEIVAVYGKNEPAVIVAENKTIQKIKKQSKKDWYDNQVRPKMGLDN